MKNLRAKILVLMILLLTILNIGAWLENAKTMDILLTKNIHVNRSTLNSIVNIPDVETRKFEMEKYITNWENNRIEQQDKRVYIFTYLSFSTLISFICIILSVIELKRKNKNVS